jgi:hypothetical protein
VNSKLETVQEKLKRKHKAKIDRFDTYDMENFQKFLAKFYSNIPTPTQPFVSQESKIYQAQSTKRWTRKFPSQKFQPVNHLHLSVY